MSEPVKLGGLFASALPQRGDKSDGQPGASVFGTLLGERQGSGDRRASMAGGEPPSWSWSKTPAPAKSSQFAGGEDDNLFAQQGTSETEEAASLDNLWSATRSTFDSRFAAGWHTQDAGGYGPDEPTPEGLGDEPKMVDLPEADEVASDPATALSAAGRPIPIENGDTTQQPDTILQTAAGKSDPKTIGPGNRDMAVGDGRRQNGQDPARPSGARAEPAEQMRAQPGGAEASRAAEGRVAEAARANASMLSGRQQPDPVAQRVTVVSSQTAPLTPPVPAAGQLMPPGTPASQIVSAISEDGELASRAATAISQAREISAARPRPVHTLQIQLHPADLGRVTARMSIEGSQLRVELQVETAQARTQLANNSDAILKALKASGYEIDRVTIQQAPQAANAGPSAGQERSANGFSAQGGEADEADAERRRREGSGDGNQQQGSSHESRHSETARGGLYI